MYQCMLIVRRACGHNWPTLGARADVVHSSEYVVCFYICAATEPRVAILKNLNASKPSN